MNPTDTPLSIGAINASTAERTNTYKRVAVGAAALMAVAGAAVLIHTGRDDTSRPPAPARTVVDRQTTTQELVDRGQIPAQSLEPTPLSMDDKLRDLVDRNQIPQLALSS